VRFEDHTKEQHVSIHMIYSGAIFLEFMKAWCHQNDWNMNYCITWSLITSWQQKLTSSYIGTYAYHKKEGNEQNWRSSCIRNRRAISTSGKIVFWSCFLFFLLCCLLIWLWVANFLLIKISRWTSLNWFEPCKYWGSLGTFLILLLFSYLSA
jgi:hypothetical protein